LNKIDTYSSKLLNNINKAKIFKIICFINIVNQIKSRINFETIVSFVISPRYFERPFYILLYYIL